MSPDALHGGSANTNGSGRLVDARASPQKALDSLFRLGVDTRPADRIANLGALAASIFNSNINSGDELSDIFGDPTVPGSIAAARAPDIFIQPNHGVIYSGSQAKIAEHGGGSLDDTHVALLVAASFLDRSKVDELVHTTQIAPSILRALGLDPDALESVKQEHTRVLPELFDNDDN